MKHPMSDRDKRALKAVAAAALMFAVLQFLVLPLWDHAQEARAQLPEKDKTLVKYRRMIEQESLLTGESARLEDELKKAEAGLLQASTDALAAAELERLLKSVAVAQQIEFTSADFQKVDKGQGAYYPIPVMVQFQSRVDQLVNFLSALQAGERLLSVQKISVQPAGGKQKRVTVTVTVSGWMSNVDSGKRS